MTVQQVLLVLLFAGCETKNEKQLPSEVVWDRDLCVECSMALSDRRYAAQIVDHQGKPKMFDDIGCAVNWLKNQTWKSKQKYQKTALSLQLEGYI